MNIERTCSKCGNVQSLTNFPLTNRTSNKYLSWCYGCYAQKMRNYRKSHPEYTKIGNLRKYGLSLEEYYLQLSRQGSRCKLCGNSFKSTKDTNVDHCHKTGKFRGFLCTKCNTGLGKFNDDPQLLQEAISYLKENSN